MEGIMTMSNELNRDLLMELGEAEDKCRSISVGGTMFDDSILSQPPTPQNLVEVLGWDGHLGHCIRSPKQPHPHCGAEIVYLPKCPTGKDTEWRIQRTDTFGPDVYFNALPTLRDVVDLCRLLGIPCEVKR